MHLHWHRLDHVAGVNEYRACRCGSRQVRRTGRYGYSPVDRHWIETGEHMPEPTIGPSSPSGCSGIERSGQGYLGPQTSVTFSLGA